MLKIRVSPTLHSHQHLLSFFLLLKSLILLVKNDQDWKRCVVYISKYIYEEYVAITGDQMKRTISLNTKWKVRKMLGNIWVHLQQLYKIQLVVI